MHVNAIILLDFWSVGFFVWYMYSTHLQEVTILETYNSCTGGIAEEGRKSKAAENAGRIKSNGDVSKYKLVCNVCIHDNYIHVHVHGSCSVQ